MTDLFELAETPCLVIGGASGIGRATALMLARAGAAVAVADLDGDGAAKVAEEISTIGGAATPSRLSSSSMPDISGMRTSDRMTSG